MKAEKLSKLKSISPFLIKDAAIALDVSYKQLWNFIQMNKEHFRLIEIVKSEKSGRPRKKYEVINYEI